MSLLKQLFLLITLLFCLVFSLHFGLSVKNIKSYLTVEAQGHAQETATSLALSLSPYMGNEADPILESMIKAIFDMGYYQTIQLRGSDNKTLVLVNNARVVDDVPAWFMRFFPMPTITARSEISNGWNPAGTLDVTIQAGHATHKLYQLVKQALLYSLLLLGGTLLLLRGVLHFILAPLKKINQLALTIANGQFTTLSPLPWTQDVRNVAISMNSMSQKLEGVLNQAKTQLGLLNARLLLDDLTGLKKKACFDTDLKQLFSEQVPAYIFMIKVADLPELVKSQGTDNIDIFLKQLAEKIQAITKTSSYESVNFYRFTGSEFVLLVSAITLAQAEHLAQALSIGLTDLSSDCQRLDIAHIGVVALDLMGTNASTLAAAHEAVEQAHLIGANRYYFRPQALPAKDAAAWKSSVFDIINNREYTVSYQNPMKIFKNDAILMVDAITEVYDQDNTLMPIGVFVSIAEKFSKIVDLDRGVTQQVLTYVRDNRIQHAIAINLSTRTVKNAMFRSWLAEVVGQQTIAKQLVFSFSAYAVAKELTVYKDFIQFVHGLGAKVMIKRFEMQFLSLEMAHALKVDCIRLPRDLSQHLTSDERKCRFISAMYAVAMLLDLPLLAEHVEQDEDVHLLQTLGVTGASRSLRVRGQFIEP